MDKGQALQSFWQSFSVPAYDESTVPTGANAPELPYITYQAVFDSLGNPVSMTASVWDRSSSWQSVSELTKRISEYIGFGRVIEIDGGFLWIKRGTPFAQRMGDEIDNSVRRMVINIAAEYLTAN